MHEAAVSPSPDLTPELQVVRHLVATRLERSIDEVVPTQRLMSDLRLGLLGRLGRRLDLGHGYFLF